MAKKMNNRVWMTAGLAAAAILAVVWSLTGGVQEVKADGHGHGKLSLSDSMGTIQSAYRYIARNANKPEEQPACLAKAEQMLAAAVAARFALPDLITQAPRAEQAELTKAYRAKMCDLVVIAAGIEKALILGDQEAVKAAIEQLKDIKKAGHDQFLDG